MTALEHSLPERPDEKIHGPSFLGLDPDWTLLFLGWLIACISTLGSLFFSYVFPLVLILARGLFPLDRHVIKYAWPLAALGWLLAAYHNLLYAELIPAGMQPCSKGISCTEEHIELFGFLSIPQLSLISFTTLVFILIILQRRSRK
jgi:disulfide bond formation protein DsbB